MESTLGGEIQIPLNLKNHCVETEMKRCRNRCISRYFKQDGDRAVLEPKMALLEEALGSLDFGMLRSTYPALAGQCDRSVVLARDRDGLPVIHIDGRPVDLKRV